LNASRPSSATYGAAQARIELDLSALRSAPNVARVAGQGVARELQASLKIIQNEQRLTVTQAQTVLATVRGQQAQIAAVARTAATQAQQAARATAQVQIQQAKAAAQVQIQQARTVAQVQIQQAKAASQAQAQAARANQGSGGGGGIARGVIGAIGGSIGGPVGAFAGAVGGGGVGGVATAIGVAAVQSARGAVEASKLATAYGRQEVAARSLAGTQGNLNSLLDAYEEATGGAVAKAQAIADVTRLQSIGFANNATQLKQFVTVARGISLATGQSQDYVISQLQLAIANKSTLRLDQLGLGVAEVEKRIDALRKANRGLTEEQAYQQGILGLAQEKFGALTTSMQGQATGVEKLAASWEDLRLQIGETVKGPVDAVAGVTGSGVDAVSEMLRSMRAGYAARQTAVIPGGLSMETSRAGAIGVRDELIQARMRVMDDIATGARPASVTGPLLEELNAKIKAASVSVAGLTALRLLESGDLPQGAPDIRAGARTGGTAYTDDQKNVMVQWSEARANIEKQTNEAILNETRQYSSQRASTIANYEKGIARDAENYARQWQQRERDLQDSIADIHSDSARQRVRWESDLAKSIADAQQDSAKRVGKLESDHTERIADYRKDSADRLSEQQEELDDRIAQERADSAERLVEIESDYQKNRERALKENADSIENAASRLDGRAVAELQQQFDREQDEADDAHKEAIAKERGRLAEYEKEQQAAHDKAIAKEKENLQEQIDEENKAYRTRLSDEADALAESIAQQKEALAQRLTDQAANDAQRIVDMQAAFDKEKAQADTERGIRLNQQATDHQDQLNEMAKAHTTRMTQLANQATAERAALDDKFKADLNALGVHVDGYTDEIERITNAAIANATRFLKGVTEAQELTSERAQIEQRLKTVVPGSSEWTEMRYRLNEIDARLKELTENGGVASAGIARVDTAGTANVGAASWNMPTGSQFNFPVAASAAQAATGTDGGISIGQLNPTLVFGNMGGRSDAEIEEIVSNAMLKLLQKAGRRS